MKPKLWDDSIVGIALTISAGQQKTEPSRKHSLNVYSGSFGKCIGHRFRTFTETAILIYLNRNFWFWRQRS